MEKTANPIPFNPETLTVRQMKDAVEALGMIFSGIERVRAGEVDIPNFLFHIEQQRDSLAQRWVDPAQQRIADLEAEIESLHQNAAGASL